MNIVVIGTGYVGLVTGTCFAEFGFHVTCVDKDVEKIEGLKVSKIPIYEPGLEELVKKTKAAGCLSFTTNLQEAVAQADVIFIAVGTPSLPERDGEADLSQVMQVCHDIAFALNPKKRSVIVTKSTVPVGTVELIRQTIQRLNPKASFDVASNPEFLREGSAIEDFMQPDRVVIGTESKHAESVLERLYHPLHLLNVPIVFTRIETAELIKYVSNAFLATKISFINEVANLCEKVDADVQEVARGIGLDSRIGGKFLNAGPGYGGSCFPKDTKALIQTALFHGAPLSILEAVVQSNEDRQLFVFNKIKKAFGGNLHKKRIAVLGVTFKANTDDIRDSISLYLIPALEKEGAIVQIYDPVARPYGETIFTKAQWFSNVYEALNHCDGALILTEWNEFRGLDLEKVKSLLTYPLIVDLRNLYQPEQMEDFGIAYHSIGRRESDIPKLQSIASVA